jgi:hypothetical protein
MMPPAPGVIDDDRLADALRQIRRDDAPDDVVAAAGANGMQGRRSASAAPPSRVSVEPEAGRD